MFGETMFLTDCSQSPLLLDMFPCLNSKGWKSLALMAGSRYIIMWWKYFPPCWELFSKILVE